MSRLSRRAGYVACLFLGLIAGWSVCNLVFGGHPRPQVSSSDAVVSASLLTQAYDSSEKRADSLYLYKILSVRGTFEQWHKNEAGQYVISLEGRFPGRTAVDCFLDTLYTSHPPEFHRPDTLTIRGRCAGRSLNVVLIQCIIEK